MGVQTEDREGVTVVRLVGRLTPGQLRDADASFRSLVARRADRILVDMSGLEALPSNGCTVLAGLFRGAQGYGGRVCLAEASPQVRGVLELVNLDQFCEWFPRRADALAALAAPPPAGPAGA